MEILIILVGYVLGCKCLPIYFTFLSVLSFYTIKMQENNHRKGDKHGRVDKQVSKHGGKKIGRDLGDELNYANKARKLQ